MKSKDDILGGDVATRDADFEKSRIKAENQKSRMQYFKSIDWNNFDQKEVLKKIVKEIIKDDE